jgi:predicted transcriptional regulator
MPDDPTVGDESVAEPEAVQFATGSAQRVAVLKRLVKGPASASAIASDRSVATADARRAAEALHDRELVELLVTDDVHAYGLTAQGERVVFVIQQNEMRTQS